MKFLVFAISMMTIIACGNQKETAQEVEAVEAEIENAEDSSTSEPEEDVDNDVEETRNYRVVGIVHVSATDCPVYIEARLENETVSMYPMNLDNRFKKEGMKIKFAYTLSRGAQPTSCDIDMVVALNDVTLMR